jgi:N-acetylmuramoyl-L-alanine amidase
MTIRTLLLALLCAGTCTHAFAQVGPQALDSAALAQRLDLMVKDDTLRAQLSVAADHVAIYASAADKAVDRPEHRVAFADIPAFVAAAKAKSHTQPIPSAEKWPHPRPDNPQPLKGYRIALDPGHVGGTMEFGELEWKFVRIARNPARGIPEDIAFNEGNLALGTALLLDSMFRAAGAEVLLTRTGEGITAFGYDFDTWLDTMQVRFERQVQRPHMLRDSFAEQEDWHRYRHACAGRWYVM